MRNGYGNEALPASERVNILSKRIINPKNGKGDYPGLKREQAILDAEMTLTDAFRDAAEQRKQGRE